MPQCAHTVWDKHIIAISCQHHVKHNSFPNATEAGYVQISFSLSFLAVISMKTPSSLWENPLSSSYLNCTHCKYAVSRNHSRELAQTLFKSSSVPSSESWVDMCNGLLNDVVLAYCCAVCWCGKRECVVRTCWMVWLMMSSETAKTACVDVGGKVWWLKWAVRQGLCAHACVCVCMCGGKKDRVSFLTILLTLFDCSSLNGATQIQEFPDLKGTTSLEILWVSPLSSSPLTPAHSIMY